MSDESSSCPNRPLLDWPYPTNTEVMDEDLLPQLNELTRMLEHEVLTQRERDFCDTLCIYRYLKSRKGSVTLAMKALRETLLWRRLNRPEDIKAAQVEKYGRTGKCYINGFDKLGRPLVFMRPTRENYKDDFEGQIMFLLFNLEQAVRLMPKGVHQVVLMIDYHGFQLSDAPSFKVTKDTIKILSSHYPELLGMAFLVNAPRIFWTFWRMISPFVDPVTHSKINFIGPNDHAKLLDYIDPEMLEADFGGQHHFVYQHEIYWDMYQKVGERKSGSLDS